jgi:hypothetical protein
MIAPASPLTQSELWAIAPVGLHSRRHDRYQGCEDQVGLDVFAEEDQRLLVKIYESLLQLYGKLKPHHDNHSDCCDELSAFIETPDYPSLIDWMSRLGHATEREQPEKNVGRLVHDLRGGAFQALLCRLQLFADSSETTSGVQNVYFLVRDHLKIMRNCVLDLDPDRFKADTMGRDHDVDLLVEKWSEAAFQVGKEPVHIRLNCQFTGTLCESCLEFASLDRIIYNMMNNAARHTTDGLVHFYIVPVPHPEDENIRFILVNRVSEEHREVLQREFHDNLGELFRGGFTTGGNGIGVRICADYCAHAYGIFDFEEAKNGGYFGARWIGDYFVAWFHWPRVGR